MKSVKTQNFPRNRLKMDFPWENVFQMHGRQVFLLHGGN